MKLQKNNLMIDAKTNYSLTAEKISNFFLLKFLEIEKEKEKLKIEKDDNIEIEIEIAELKKLIGYNSKDIKYLFDSMRELQTTQFFRNFEYKGKEISYFQGQFINDITVYKEHSRHFNISLNTKFIMALRQSKYYTTLELEQVEKFRTKHGLKLFQMIKRYYNFNQADKSKSVGSIDKTMEELNDMLGTEYEYSSEMIRILNRAGKEIFKITDEEITISKNGSKINIAWQKINTTLHNERNFINFMRKNFVNKVIYEGIDANNGDKLQISIAENGTLYNKLSRNIINSKRSKEMWNRLYQGALQKKLPCLAQKTFDFEEA